MKNIVFIILVLAPFFGYSQDIITTKKGEDIEAKVLEINTSEVKYKKANVKDSPTYTLLKSDILLIRYENGTKDIFSEEKNVQNAHYQPLTLNNRGNKIYQNGQRIKGEGIKSILVQDPEALRLYNQGQSLKTMGLFTGIASVGCSLWFFLDSLEALESTKRGDYSEKDVNWTPVIAALGLAIPSTIFTITGKNKVEEAVNVYNLNQGRKVSIQPVIGGNSVGLVIKF